MKCIVFVSLVFLISTSFAKSRTDFLQMSSNYLVVDRVLEDSVICEDNMGDICLLKVSQFKGIPLEGDVIRVKNGEYKVDKLKTIFRKVKIRKRLNRLIDN